MRGPWLRLAPLVALAVLLLCAPSAAAITRSQANKAALKALKPQREKAPVVVFGLARPLPAKAVVFEAGLGPRTKGRSRRSGNVTRTTIKVRPVGRRAWLFWEDLAPDGLFQKPSVLLLVDDRTGRVLRRQPLSWWPLVNARRPAFLKTLSAYQSSKYRVFDSTAPDAAAARGAFRQLLERSPAASTAQSTVTGPPKLPNDCLVTIGDRVDPLFKGDFQLAKMVGGLLKLRQFDAKSVADLEKKIDQAVKATPPCKDIVILISAHGWAGLGSNIKYKGAEVPESKHAQVTIKSTFTTAAGTAVVSQEHLDARKLRRIIRKYKASTTFKLIVNACFSGRWTSVAAEPNVRVVATASRNDQFGWGNLAQGKTYATMTQTNGKLTPTGLTATDTTTNATGASEFTNGILRGLISWADSASERMETGDDLAKGIVKAFEHQRENNFAEQVGWSRAQLRDETMRMPPPPPPPPPVAPPPPPPPPASLPEEAKATWTHGSGVSNICVDITGTAGQVGDVTMNGTLSPAVQVFTLDATGRARVIYTINTATTYMFSTRWPRGDGTFNVRDGSVNVAPPPTNGPAPPSGFAACPAPS
jgi:hypothetical protein